MFDGHAVAIDGMITDLSETEARVFTRQGLTEDDTITVDLRSGGLWLFKTRGHVVWRRDDVLEPADASIGSGSRHLLYRPLRFRAQISAAAEWR